MKAYKAFNHDWTCRGFQYEVGKSYEMKGKPELCKRGFHACTVPADCFDYYDFTDTVKFAEVEIDGDIDGPNDDCSKVAATKIAIVREIGRDELLLLVNTGKCNAGIRNSADWNSGDWNSGYRNSGDRNSGDRNSGNWNSGDRNSGNLNSGDRNSGDRNSGDWNSADWNSGDWNSGYRNSGDRNSGDRNSGNWNSGNRNSGDLNSGNWNSGNHCTGYFNSKTPDEILVFNKPCNRQAWDACEKPRLIYFKLCEWVWSDDMTDEEKEAHPDHEVIGGYLATIGHKKAWAKSWGNADDDDKKLLYALPNFDPTVFEDISGIDVTKDSTWAA